jgi:UDP-N-acetylmuramoyl-L-alanyl-D-glutamate--2,6-diaminopimelate ligase
MSAPTGRVGSAAVVRILPSVPFTEVAAAVGAEVRGAPRSAPVVDAFSDSREVTSGSVFFCVPGERADGHDHARDAVAAGAVGVVVERWLDLDVPQARVPSVRAAMGAMSAVVHGHPARSLQLVGVTGTNGKTTVTYLLEAILERAGRTSGIIGTTGARVAGTPVPLERTTPEASDLQRLLARMRDGGVAAVAMEVSSHALAQHRVDGMVFDVALFTNLSQDHLDLHGSMEEYFSAKARLFTPDHARRGVANADDPWARRLLTSSGLPIDTFAVDRDADLRATDVVVDASGVAFSAGAVRVRSALRGRFNVSNITAALAVARALDIDLVEASEAVGTVVNVPGRMEPVQAGQEFLVMVDYAHTPDSILGVLRASRPLTTGRLIVVFGCGGDRDRAKRPFMGRAATAAADLTVLTSDNPRSEDPLEILAQIEAGAADGGGAYVVRPDRREAIRLGLTEARPGDVVVIAGKGHETVQELGDAAVPFDDRRVAAEELARLLERS